MSRPLGARQDPLAWAPKLARPGAHAEACRQPRSRPASRSPGRTRGGGCHPRAGERRVPASESLIPPNGQADRRADEPHHAVGLHEVAPLLAGAGIDVLGEEPMPVAAGERGLQKSPPPIRKAHAPTPDKATY